MKSKDLEAARLHLRNAEMCDHFLDDANNIFRISPHGNYHSITILGLTQSRAEELLDSIRAEAEAAVQASADDEREAAKTIILGCLTLTPGGGS